ncbi:MAG: hypothetical protein EPN19_02010 [Betaproteobacteria bacterium]|nr:MAG: hypothetical protein EPN19_02010 [Betaproteobacteria bacterium]
MRLPGWNRRAWLCAAAALATMGCVTQEEKRDATAAVNRAFQVEYERILAEKGVRSYKVKRTEAFVALHAALSRLGMRVESQEPEVGYLNVYAPAPTPLNAQEWRQAAESDLPKIRAIARPHIGMAAEFISFEPEGLLVVINATAVDVAAGTEVSLTMRMREVAPPKSGMPRREYPPPTAVRIGLDKIWAQFEQELRAARRIA